MKRVDDEVRKRLQSDTSSQNVKGGALQNRLSAKCDSVKDIQMGGEGSNELMDGEGKSQSDSVPSSRQVTLMWPSFVVGALRLSVLM